MKKVNLKESAPIGSFDRIVSDLKEALSTAKRVLFPEISEYETVELEYTFPEKIIVAVREKYYEIGYQMSVEGKITFTKPVPVEEVYVPAVKESSFQKSGKTLASELKEAGIEVVKEAQDMDFDLSDFTPIQEGKYNADTGEVEIVIIESGTNPTKKRHYPDSTIREAASNFSGLKMYLNHPTKREETEMPERDIRNWASTIVESWYDNGKAMAKVAVHDSWLRERLADPVARQHIGVSINTGGKVAYGKVNGEEMQIVEKIVLARSNGPATVDWVTEAGARGRVSRLLKESQEEQTKEKSMDLKEAKLEDLQKENPALLECIRKGVMESEEIVKLTAELKEAQAKLQEAEAVKAATAQGEKVNALLKESKLPQVAKDRVFKVLSEKVYEDEAKLKEAFETVHKAEMEYASKLSGKGKIILSEAGKAEGEDKSLLESSQTELERRMGIKSKEKK